VGPTGVGKTKLSIVLAKKYQGIIINADAMQVYQQLNIGTAKISKEEQGSIPHYLFDIIDVQDDYTVYDYQKDFRKIIDENLDRNIFIVGGSGLYIKAGLYDYVFNEFKEKNEYNDYSNKQLYALVKKTDINSDIHPNNRRRMISFLNRGEVTNNKNNLLYDCHFIGLRTNREILYQITDERVDKMISDGLLEEVKSLYDKNIRSKALLTAIGYKELYAYLDGYISLPQAIMDIKKNTRHFIKRQYTWYSHQMNIKWFEVNFEDFDQTILDITNYLETHDTLKD